MLSSGRKHPIAFWVASLGFVFFLAVMFWFAWRVQPAKAFMGESESGGEHDFGRWIEHIPGLFSFFPFFPLSGSHLGVFWLKKKGHVNEWNTYCH